MRFWLRRGVDGFRVDVMWHLIKDELLRDNPPNPDFANGDQPYTRLLPLYSTDRPEVHEVIAEMRQVMDEFDDRVLIGEIYLAPEKLVAYYGRDLTGAHLPFNFALISTPWDARAIARLVETYEAALPPGGWPNWVLGNHDRRRVASRVGRDQARVAAMLLLTLRGTPTLYYGDELGMEQVDIPPDRVRDPFEKNVPGIGVGRDGCRTPMQWDASPSSGFSGAEPWLPLSPNASRANVAVESLDSVSMLSLYRALISLRAARPELAIGTYACVAVTDSLLAFEREHAGQRSLIVLNFRTEPASIALTNKGQILLSTFIDRQSEVVDGKLTLRGAEGIILEPFG